MGSQEQFDEAMYQFSVGEFDRAITGLRAILEADPGHFDAQLALGMACFRKGDIDAAIAEGHKAEKMRPNEQLVHTNLSLFYMKAGDKAKAEHHGLQARIASWRTEAQQAKSGAPISRPAEPELEMAKAKPASVKIPSKFPEMPWKKKKTDPNA